MAFKRIPKKRGIPSLSQVFFKVKHLQKGMGMNIPNFHGKEDNKFARSIQIGLQMLGYKHLVLDRQCQSQGGENNGRTKGSRGRDV